MRRAGILALALASVAVVSSGPEAHAFAKAPPGPREFTKYRVQTVTQKGQSWTIVAQNPSGAATVFTEKDLGCFKLTYGPNLASCLQSCDGKTALTLTSEPDYLDAWSSSDQLRWTGELTRSVQPESETNLVVRYRNGKWELLPTVDAGVCGVGAKAFDGDSCLKKTAESIFSTNPVASYLDALTELHNQSLTSLINQVASVKSALEARGLTTFARQGEFFAENLRNAPTLICQIKSQQGPDATLQAALADDRGELERSADFLGRLR